MEMYNKPEVTLLALTQVNPCPTNDLLDYGSKPETLIEFAGRICYNSLERMGKNPNFIQARIDAGHETIIEHASATFLIEGISRACSHQVVRHRIASISQASQRFVEHEGDDRFVIPESIMVNAEAMDKWGIAISGARLAYRELRKLGIRKEDARFVLPSAAKTRLVLTMNYRSLRHFFKLRCHKSAQWEIREVAREMYRLIQPTAPSVFDDIAELCSD